ncbi:preprotein translocase subunit SecA [Oceanotoga sp. DSM 15011]|jgi:preprotein translocase subunit SecA|uniref:Protein translocase subunit SecA n=2 Tax=Bacteria TaxID=2 RepID=A0AA45C884_9BACT|nr:MULTISPECIES: preprotein translocase subunit SecA [Oceanotoga]MDN5343244.1 preprotein translocase subunit SecA [Oceanotoga sp.]MDO7976797.1 preprotein translocase subunit SecA [Oceanotoga teriensis]PWJ95873.1 preprotein translocase subunit SecA [Oceanotoga teriensis]UYP00902.1 preprotein translocase subunit SecA [Oceanotoga sp. DSM 15011]
MKLFGLFDKNKKLLKQYSKRVEKINELESQMTELKDEELKQKTEDFKNRLKNGETVEDILEEAFAVVRETSKRILGMRHFDVQLIGGISLHDGKVAEMKTGEGKTLVATLPLYLNALTGKNCQLATHNDYLAQRDANWMRPIYEFLGLSVGFIYSGMSKEERKNAYECDITYGTANEFGFDYLRDNLVYSLEDKSQRDHYFTIVDEADSILIDEARTPLIISGPSDTPSELYRRFAMFSRKFENEKDYTIDEKQKTVALTEEGIEKAEKMLNIENLYDPQNIKYLFHLLNALKANLFFKKDKDYIIQDGEVVIVDEFTGRLLDGRRYSEGLHQSIEAKEGVKVNQESLTYATITFQNYFRMYDKLAGMTGTAKTEEEEFQQIYNCDVIVIPTNKPVVRMDKNDLIFKTEKEKYNALIDEIEERNKKGQPMLVGTTSIENSELISKLLKKRGVKHEVLNAKQHEREAEIVMNAGNKNSVTIATNMAGRGTDIKINDEVKELGGLYVIGTERHESRRIDNQLVGRSGRQGDPGESRFFLSFEDEMLRLFGGEKLKNIMNTLKIEEGQPIEHKLLSNIIRDAQKKVEGIHFSIRKRLYELDSVMDQQRNSIYNHRNWILEQSNHDEHIKEIFEDVTERISESAWDEKEEKLDKELVKNKLNSFLINKEIKSQDMQELRNEIFDLVWNRYEQQKEDFGEEFSKVSKYVMLRIIDEKWRNHLDAIEALKEAVGLRAYGQKNPTIEFKKEAYYMFTQLVDGIYDDIVNYLLRIVKVDSQREEKETKKVTDSLNYMHGEYSALNRDGRRKEKQTTYSEKMGKIRRGKIKVKK